MFQEGFVTKEGGLGGPWPRHYRYPYHERGELYSRAISSFKGFFHRRTSPYDGHEKKEKGYVQ